MGMSRERFRQGRRMLLLHVGSHRLVVPGGMLRRRMRYAFMVRAGANTCISTFTVSCTEPGAFAVTDTSAYSWTDTPRTFASRTGCTSRARPDTAFSVASASSAASATAAATQDRHSDRMSDDRVA